MEIDRDKLSFGWYHLPSISDFELKEFADLFSNHYGFWSDEGIFPGGRVRLSLEKLKSDWVRENSWAATCRHAGKLAGYAFAIKSELKARGSVSWVTQLVVHSDFRHQKIATELLQSIWAFSDDFAWGLVTANPFTVRALEKATRRRCDPFTIKAFEPLLSSIGDAHIPFVKKRPISISEKKTTIDTGFHVDHSEIAKKIETASKEHPWLLGHLEAGEEWYAFTFREQESFDLTAQEFDELMTDSERVVQEAYSRMSLDENHLWTRHTEREADFIKSELGIQTGSSLLDFGCGSGRHSLALARLGLNTTGVDFVESLILKASSKAKKEGIQHSKFITGDCRTINLSQKFDFGICLYDVIGSFRDDNSNVGILKNLITHIKPGGKILISVMNIALTKKLAIHSGELPRDLNKISILKPSHTMENTGNIFDPDFYFLDAPKKLVYRKEKFSEGYNLPTQILVADRRYEREELGELCTSLGLRVIWSKCPRLGEWTDEIDETDKRAKEILLLAEIPQPDNSDF